MIHACSSSISVTEIKQSLTKDFSNICDWFVDHKLSIHNTEDKTKSILFSSKCHFKLVAEFDIGYRDKNQATWWACELFGVCVRWNNVGWNNGS